MRLPNTVTYDYNNPAPAAVASGEPGYIQHIAQGTADGLSALTVRRVDVETELQPVTLSPAPAGGDPLVLFPGSAAQNVGADVMFGTHAKGAASPDTAVPAAAQALDDRVADSFAVTANPAPGDEPWVIGNTQVVFRAGDLARIVLLGPTTTQTVAEVWTLATQNVATNTGNPTDWQFRIGDFMINPLETFDGDFDPRYAGLVAFPNGLFERADDQPGPDPRVSYGIELLDRVTTLSPANDGLDNDGDSRIDDEDEQLIPGRININTASADTLARALSFDPISGFDNPSISAAKQDLINLILALRENPTTGARRLNQRLQTGGTPNRPRPGISWMGEILESMAGGGPSGLADAATFISGTPPLMTDFNEYEQGEPSSRDAIGLGPGLWTADGFSVDREQLLGPWANLNQVASVRSDIFTAYVLVRGYPSSDFGANPVEEFRIVATFDRSVVHGARPLPRLRSVAVFRQL